MIMVQMSVSLSKLLYIQGIGDNEVIGEEKILNIGRIWWGGIQF